MHVFFYSIYPYFIRFNAFIVMIFMAFMFFMLYTCLPENSSDELMLRYSHALIKAYCILHSLPVLYITYTHTDRQCRRRLNHFSRSVSRLRVSRLERRTEISDT